ncbi:MAG: hypothetical protein WEB62_08875 [Bacteroidota bacterium]
MNFNTFKRLVSDLPFVLTADLLDRLNKKEMSGRQGLLNQLTRWQKKGLLVKLRRGMYILNEQDRRTTPPRAFLANQMYTPSYVSLEYALALYGLIPERVADVTSVSTKKTARFSNALGVFSYQHVSPAIFRGFRTAKDDQGFNYFIAEPEKAVLDFLYFNVARSRRARDVSMDVFSDSYRFQNVEEIDEKRLLDMAGQYSNPTMRRLGELFCRFKRQQ